MLHSLNPDQFERLIKTHLEAQGATAYIPAKNERDKEGDADIVATFDALKVIVYVQAKRHDGQTNKWPVTQVREYAGSQDDRGTDDGYTRLLWVISTAERFSAECVDAAHHDNVRLINGEEFAKMLLDSGIEQLQTL